MNRPTLILIMFLNAVCVSSVSGADLSREEAVLLIQEGNRFFEAGTALLDENPTRAGELFSDALLHFERAIREGGISNGKLYYNVANTYFRLGDLGRAILNYRRALRLRPLDSNLHQNLDYARSKREDRIARTENRRAMALVLFWHYNLPFWIKGVVFTVCFALLWIAAAFRLLYKRAVFLWLVGAAALCAAIFLGSLVADSVGRRDEGVIITETVIARKGNAETYQPSFSEPLHAGTEFTIIEARGDWSYIELLDGRRTWILSDTHELL